MVEALKTFDGGSTEDSDAKVKDTVDSNDVGEAIWDVSGASRDGIEEGEVAFVMYN